jgi:SAM-dependent methyltransferase
MQANSCLPVGKPPDEMSYYRADLALVHHRGFGAHAQACAPGILELLRPVRRATVLELGCGSGLLTKELVAGGHKVIATDASAAMLSLLEEQHLPGVETGLLQLPCPLPAADAIVGVGHVLNYLPSTAAINRTWAAIAAALRPGGVLALDICDLEWGRARRSAKLHARQGEDWSVVTEFSRPRPDLFVRDITTFVREEDGTYRRDHERHDNVLVDTRALPRKLAKLGLDVRIGNAFGSEELPVGLRTVVGTRRATD